MTDKPTPTDAAAPECLTCSDHGVVGNSGFDYKTAADLLSGKTVSDDALRKFVAASRGAHDARAALHAKMLSLQGELASREAEIALLKRSLLDAEADAAAPQPPTAPATQQAGAEPPGIQALMCVISSLRDIAHFSDEEGGELMSALCALRDWAHAQTVAAPQPSPTAQAAGSVLEDAVRYRFLRDGEWRGTDLEPFIRLQLNTLWDAKIDAAHGPADGESNG